MKRVSLKKSDLLEQSSSLPIIQSFFTKFPPYKIPLIYENVFTGQLVLCTIIKIFPDKGGILVELNHPSKQIAPNRKRPLKQSKVIILIFLLYLFNF
jgi:hypothetical protein